MLYYLNGLFVGFLILANVLAVKVFSIGEWMVLPAAAILIIFTYPLIDVICEVYGKEAGGRTVRTGLIAQVFAVFFIAIAIELPPAQAFVHQQEFETILGGSMRVIIASLVAYSVSVNLDVMIFSKFKEKHGDGKLWLRNNASTMLSQLIDTALFITIAFFGILPFKVLLILFITQYIFKFLASIVATPLVYGLVYVARKFDKLKSIEPSHY
ncbi:transporter [Lysinibacillus sphaericus]|uniref:queuosine precursor transporter n=1 Tax=Lysinibacillus sphaericus TaxID=1421 RepID=UPI0018CDD4DA|nr:queuosine precursor transporter [Lysinibacillus sphaericus]MBG9456639.1 transporter [Lysinibacillus sphaericus]MBG9480038.1 transporter [Lysinibacillus sphaericus]MBG9594250.1 transporter [Lysinibacillus sphaericus]